MIAVPNRRVMERHDFHAGLIELILDVLVQFPPETGHDLRGIGIGVKFVGHIKIIQPGLEHEGGQPLEKVLGDVGRLDEQGVDRLPGGVVADCDAGVEDQAVAVPDLMAEIGDVAGEDNAVGYGNDLVFVSFLAGDIELAFQYYPHGLPHLDHIAFLERPGIGQADPRNQVGNGRR